MCTFDRSARAIATLLLLLTAPIGRAETEYDVKAAYLVRFTKFVRWPSTAFASEDAPFVIGIGGRDPFEGSLERFLEGNMAGTRRLEVRHLNAHDISALRECQMIFVGHSDHRRLDAILSVLQGRPVIVVGESEGFAGAGGMVGFASREKRVGIEVNFAAASSARLKISSQLLNIAKIVN
jgi:hypothetical protein